MLHLVGLPSHKNLGEAVEDFLIRAHIHLPEANAPQPTQERPLTTYSATPAQQGRTQARLLRKWKLYERIHELHEAGMSLRKIGSQYRAEVLPTSTRVTAPYSQTPAGK